MYIQRINRKMCGIFACMYKNIMEKNGNYNKYRECVKRCSILKKRGESF